MKLKIILLHLCFLFSIHNINAQMQQVSYSDGSQKLNGVLAKTTKPNPKKAGVLILPAWMGIDDHSKTVAKQLADQGYTSFVVDIYGEGHYPKSPKEAGEQSGYYKKNIAEYHKRIRFALEQLVKSGVNPDEVVVIGYCFGGGGAIEAARTNMKVKGIVSFHGSYGRDSTREIALIQPKILILHGADDPYSSAE